MGQGRARRRNPRGMNLRRCLLVFLAGAGCNVLAQGYPERPVRLIVPQAAGSATDTVARILAAELPNHLGQPVVVENKPGGALTIGLDITAKSAPDGYTIGMGPVGALAITRHMVAKLPYDIERDFQPIALVTRGHLLLAVSPSLAVNSVQELIEYARKNPGRLMNASSSNGSPGHVGGELFKYMTGTQIVHIPYKGGAMAINDLIAGHVQLMFESLNSISTYARSGKVKALAGLSEPADDRRGGSPGLRREYLERRDRARGNGEARRRQAEYLDQQSDRLAHVQGEVRRDRRRTGGRHSRGVRGSDSPRLGEVG